MLWRIVVDDVATGTVIEAPSEYAAVTAYLRDLQWADDDPDRGDIRALVAESP